MGDGGVPKEGVPQHHETVVSPFLAERDPNAKYAKPSTLVDVVADQIIAANMSGDEKAQEEAWKFAEGHKKMETFKEELEASKYLIATDDEGNVIPSDEANAMNDLEIARAEAAAYGISAAETIKSELLAIDDGNVTPEEAE